MRTTIEDLLVAESEVASDVIASSLYGLVNITRESGTVIPTSDFEQLDRNSKIIVCLLALRAATALGVTKDAEATTDQIASVVGFDAKSVGEYASRLKRTYVTRGSKGYLIPTEKIRLASAAIDKARQRMQEAR